MFEWETDPAHEAYLGGVWEAGWWQCEACKLMDQELDLHTQKMRSAKSDAPTWGRSVRLFRKVDDGV